MKIRNWLFVGGIALTTSCATQYYAPSLEESSATVSFANLTQQAPQLKIVDSCKVSQIDNRLIEERDPRQTSKNRLKIPAQKKITFEYNSIWFGKDATEVRTQGSVFFNTTMVEKTKTAETCKRKITFIPEEGKHYEVYFGKGKDKCVLGVSEANIEPGTKQKKLYEVEATSEQGC